jgi:hypothetical protein
VNNLPEDRSERLDAAFDAARTVIQALPPPEQHARVREQFLAEARSVSPDRVMRLRDQTGALSDLTLIEGERHMNRFYARQTRLIAAVLFGVIVAGGFWATPALRAFAQSVLGFFTPAESDAVVTQVPAEGNTYSTSNPYAVTLDQVATRVDFARLPTSLPEGYQFGAASYVAEQQKVGITYVCNDLWMLTLIEQTSETPAAPQEVGASANIIDVPIRETTGQYVRGVWETPSDVDTVEPDIEGEMISVPQVWNENTEWQQLVWREDGINFTLTSNGTMVNGDSTTCALDKDDFAAVALSLQPASTIEQ